MNNKTQSISKFSKRFGLSRSTLLYYERIGLLLPCTRSLSGYRYYGEAAALRLQTILAYRAYGIELGKIANLIESQDKDSQKRALQDQFNALESEIQQLRHQQKAIVIALENADLTPVPILDKSRWVAIMKAAGFDEKTMNQWHQKFEKMEPEAHDAFLRSLQIDEQEIKRIRQLN
jgi:DNA-binding transcriptional MerR regulator